MFSDNVVNGLWMFIDIVDVFKQRSQLFIILWMFSDNEVNGCDDDDDDWAVDVSDAAVAERMKDLTAGVKRLTVSNNADKSQSERLELFFNYCKVNYYIIIFNYYLVSCFFLLLFCRQRFFKI